MTNERVYKMAFSRVYPLLVQKAERKGRTKSEVDAQQVITSTIRGRAGEQKDSSGIWETLEMAWQPFLLGASFMPGAGLIPKLTQTISQGKRKSSSVSFSKSLWQFTRKWLKEDKS